MSVKTCREALNEALRAEMEKDENVILLGEDIGVHGGGFGVTSGLLQQFGPDRVIETPISESAFAGTAVGAAMSGLRPVVELMFSDFASVCLDQIINQAAKVHFLSNGKLNVPLVIRAGAGGGTGAGAQHSQSLEQLYCNVPGLKVLVPSNAYDAKGLLVSAVRDPNPVIFLEGKLLYDSACEVPDGEYVLPIGKAALCREGSDVSLISWGRCVGMCLEAADMLAERGVSAEVLDLRTLSPLDSQAVLKTAEKTGRVVIAHESVQFAGFGAEIAALIAGSDAAQKLKAPIKRVGARFCPVPAAQNLEAYVLPDTARILSAVNEII